MQVAVDSSVLVAAYRPSEQHHTPAESFLNQLLAGDHTATAPFSVLVEVAAAIRRRTGSSDNARRVAEDLLAVRNLEFVPLDAERASRATDLAARLGLRGMDALVVSIADEYQCGLLTLDVQMRQAAAMLVPVLSLDDL